MSKIIHENLQRVQKSLEKLYDMNLDVDISDYLVDEERAKQSMDWDAFYSQLSFENMTQESEITINGCVIINEEQGHGLPEYNGVGLGLYLDEDVVSCIEEQDPYKAIDNTNFKQYQTLLEEASHLIYAMNGIKYQKPFTKLEQEIQACVDQFILTVFNVGRLNKGAIPKGYIDYFTNPDIDVESHMNSEFRERYETASRTGARYCKHLYESHLRNFNPKLFNREVCEFYNETQNGKIRRVDIIRNSGKRRKIPRINLNDSN